VGCGDPIHLGRFRTRVQAMRLSNDALSSDAQSKFTCFINPIP
jgi:hypothetical protein